MNILFVCTGNTCRSPMAEALFRKMLQRAGRTDIICGSAGLSAGENHPASPNAVEACRELGIDLSAHRSRSLTPEDIQKTDVFFGMTPGHAEVLRRCGVPEEKIYVPVPAVPDPFMQGLNTYRACRDAIIQALRVFYRERLHD